MYKHEMRITVGSSGEEPISIAKFKKLPLFERLLNRWFGNTQKLMVIVPQDSVQKIEIKEM